VAARVLSDFFERVTILERDALDQGGAARAGVPQGKHLHALLAGGQRVLEELLPGFRDELERVGAVRIRTGLDLLVERPGFDPFPQRDLGISSASLTRPQLEYCVRRRVEAIQGIRIEPGCRVLALVATDDGSGIRGVRFQRDGRSETRTADLVVDASGSGELTLGALRAGGHPTPEETTIVVDLGYSTTIFDIPADAPQGWRGVMHLPAIPQSSRAGLLTTIEGNRWMLALGGRFGEHPPGDEAGFREYTTTLRTRTIADAIAGARMVVDVERYRFRESRLRHFERLGAFPRGLLPIADAICRFNPIFGQGMSVAALQAHALGQVLAACTQEGGAFADAWRPFFRKVADTIEAPWAFAAVPDLAFPSTIGQRPPDFAASLRFSVALARAMAIHPDIHKLSGEVQHLLRPRSALMEPHVLERILREMPT
jgi:2-polyprenyl-6-methoxyphenol hydroxylase-like FAD-dependent oxidoreductase